MSAKLPEQRGNVGCFFDCLAQNPRRQILLNGVPRRVNRLFVIKRIFTCHTLAPSLRAVGVQGEQQDTAFSGALEAGLKEMDQRHADLTHGNGFNLHECLARYLLSSALSSQRPSRKVPLSCWSRS